MPREQIMKGGDVSTCAFARRDVRCQAPYSKTGTKYMDVVTGGPSQLSLAKRTARQAVCVACKGIETPLFFQLLDYVDTYTGEPQSLIDKVGKRLNKGIRESMELEQEADIVVRQAQAMANLEKTNRLANRLYETKVPTQRR